MKHQVPMMGISTGNKDKDLSWHGLEEIHAIMSSHAVANWFCALHNFLIGTVTLVWRWLCFGKSTQHRQCVAAPSTHCLDWTRCRWGLLYVTVACSLDTSFHFHSKPGVMCVVYSFLTYEDGRNCNHRLQCIYFFYIFRSFYPSWRIQGALKVCI